MARYNYNEKLITEELEKEICPLTIAQDAIAGRWKIIILSHLSKKEVIRFNELLRMIPGVSKGILTRQLRELEEYGIIHREVYKEVPPKVEYSLTEDGKRFKPVLDCMFSWGEVLLEKRINK